MSREYSWSETQESGLQRPGVLRWHLRHAHWGYGVGPCRCTDTGTSLTARAAETADELVELRQEHIMQRDLESWTEE